MRKYLALGVVLLVVASIWLGLSKFAGMVKANVEKQLTELIQTTIQKTVDERFNHFREEYKGDLKDLEERRRTDTILAGQGSSALNGVGNGWVYVNVPAEPSVKAPETGTAIEQRITRKVRAELSAEFSGAIKSEARRADQCAIDYNTLKGNYNALERQIIQYNLWVDEYNKSMGFTK